MLSRRHAVCGVLRGGDPGTASGWHTSSSRPHRGPWNLFLQLFCKFPPKVPFLPKSTLKALKHTQKEGPHRSLKAGPSGQEAVKQGFVCPCVPTGSRSGPSPTRHAAVLGTRQLFLYPSVLQSNCRRQDYVTSGP